MNTQQKYKLIIDKILDGESYEKIANDIGVSRQSLYATMGRMRREGIDIPKRRDVIDEIKKENYLEKAKKERGL